MWRERDERVCVFVCDAGWGSTGSGMLCYYYARVYGLDDGLYLTEGKEERQKRGELLFVIFVRLVFGMGILQWQQAE